MLAAFVLSVLVVDADTSAKPPVGKPPAGKPHVVVIWSDDLTAHALGCYGNAAAITPNIDRLASRGVRFDRMYCAYPVCGPTRAACMAGMDAEALGIMGNGESGKIDEVMAGRPSMTEALRAAGYRTMRSGKVYHMRVPGDITAGSPGFDHAPSWDKTYDAHAPEWRTEGEATPLCTTKIRKTPGEHFRLGFGGAFYEVKGSGDGSEQADSLIADNAVAMIDTHQADHAARPMALHVGFVRPHVPLVAPAPLFEAFPIDEMTLPTVPEDEPESIAKSFRRKSSEAWGLTDDRAKQRVIASYLTATHFMDQQVGRVLDALDRHGLTDNTIVLFQSDHGYHLGEHDFWQKFSILEESARIPAVIAGPGIPHKSTAALASQIDLYPTLCDLVGAAIPEHVQGKSLVPVITGEADRVHDAVTTAYSFGRVMRTDRYAYLRATKTNTVAVFDMQTDPGQHDNIAETQPDVTARLAKRFDALRAEFGLAP